MEDKLAKQRSRFYWENDYSADEDYDIKNVKNIEVKPKGKYLQKFSFASEVMAPIVTSIMEAIESQQVIGICGDYDVDGTAGTAILYKTILALGGDVHFQIPQRFVDGYGISERIVDEFQTQNVSCIITVDNGISAIDAIRYANEKGMQTIVTDHHTVGKELPAATYILHPELDETISFKEVCGAFVAYQLACELLKHSKYAGKDALISELQQFAMIATIADMMPIRDVNRDITYVGFQNLKNNPAQFFESYQKIAEISSYRSDDLSYNLLPTINSVGRLGDSNEVVSAMCSDDSEYVEEKLSEFIDMNVQRKQLTNDIYLDALEQLDYDSKGFQLIVGHNWNQGVLGIVAQRLMQQSGQPIIVITQSQQDENLYVGSARAFGGYNVYECFEKLQALLLKYGGHQYAGGLSIALENIKLVKQALSEYNQITVSELSIAETTPQLYIDTWQKLSSLDMKFLQYQEKFEPFGEDNKPFTVGIHGVKIEQIQELGKTKEHVKLFVEQDGKKFQIIAFSQYDLMTQLATHAIVDLVVHVQVNVFNGQTTVQYLLVDIKKPENQIFDYRSIKFQQTEIIENENTLVINDVPLDVDAFIAQTENETVSSIYLKKIAFEDLFIYETTISKDAFNYVYKTIAAQEKVHLDADTTFEAFYQKKLPKSIVLYIIKVFFELGFVIIEENICIMNSNVTKKSLEDSNAYGEMNNWLAFRNLILFEPIDKISEKLF